MRHLLHVILLISCLTACTAPTALPPTVEAIKPSALPPTRQPPTATPIPTATPVPLPTTQWAGGIVQADGTTDSILVNFADTASTLTIQPKLAALPIDKLEWDGKRLAFSAKGEHLLEFAGLFVDGQVTGTVTNNGKPESFSLLPMVTVNDSALNAWAGTYRLASGAAITVHVSPSYSNSTLDFFWSGLTISHFGTGDIRGLYPIANDTFLVGRARVLGDPFAAQIKFRRDTAGVVTGFNWQERDPATGKLGLSHSAERINLTTETVHFTSSDGVTLTGLLTLPDTPGPHPAIVVLHGSEAGTRSDFGRQQLSTFFASEGLAVLTYDKRGVGDSGGVYVERASESNLTTLAEDALAGVAYLKGRSEVNGKKIGLIGSSQAGWIIPIAAQKSSDVNFFIILSGPVVSVGEEAVYSSYTNDGDTETHYPPEIIATAIARIAPSGFDPLPILTGLKQPGLWLWGGHDLSQPVPQDEVKLKKLIAEGLSNFSYVIFADGDHNLQVSQQGLFNEIPYSTGYTTGFFATLSTWLKALPK